MTGEEFKALLKEAGLTQRRLALLVERFSGAKLAASTTSRWVTDVRGVNPLAVAVVKLFKRLPEQDRAAILSEADQLHKNTDGASPPLE